MRNPEDLTSIIPEITPESFEQLKADGIVTGGMIPKIENALDAVRLGVSKVVITQADALLDGGTTIHL
jgi:acetylglutamate kinase